MPASARRDSAPSFSQEAHFKSGRGRRRQFSSAEFSSVQSCSAAARAPVRFMLDEHGNRRLMRPICGQLASAPTATTTTTMAETKPKTETS